MNSEVSSAAFTRQLQKATSANVVSHAAFSSRVLCEPLHSWKRSVFDRLDELCRLCVGWDGYRAPPVSFSNAHFAASMLVSACPLETPEPQIVPGPNADLQIEWHTETTDIELHVNAPYDVDAWRLKHATPDQEEEVHLERDFSIVARWIAELAEDSVAARRSTA